MLNINNLEQRWVRYKLKSYIPYVVIILSVIFLITAVYFFFFTEIKVANSSKTPKKTIHTQIKQSTVKTLNTVEKHPNNNKPITIIHETKITKKSKPVIEEKKKIQQDLKPQVQYTSTKANNKQETIIQEQEENVVLEPAMGFLEHLNDSSTLTPIKQKQISKKKIQKKPTHKRTKIVSIETPKEDYMNYPIEKKEKKQEKQIEKVEANNHKKTIIIKREESRNDIKEVLSRFKNNNNPALSLFVAKKYYEIGDYKQAYNYALITNKINNDIEESWIIFAKSLVKLGEKDKAINTLKEYIHYSHSSNAQILLDEIQRGKFR